MGESEMMQGTGDAEKENEKKNRKRNKKSRLIKSDSHTQTGGTCHRLYTNKM